MCLCGCVWSGEISVANTRCCRRGELLMGCDGRVSKIRKILGWNEALE